MEKIIRQEKQKRIKKRTLKVYYRYYPQDKQPHPLIRLSGKYISDLDFKIGDVIEVVSKTGKILIRKKRLH